MPGSPLAELRWFRIGSVEGGQQIHFGFEDETFQAGSLSVVRCSVFFVMIRGAAEGRRGLGASLFSGRESGLSGVVRSIDGERGTWVWWSA